MYMELIDENYDEYTCVSEEYDVRFYPIREYAVFIFQNGENFERPMTLEQKNYFLRSRYWYVKTI